MSKTLSRPAQYGLFGAVFLASIAPLRNYDLFWHLATGRWILEHRALPLRDPFAVASDRILWINGEWLFEIVAHLIELAGGLTALSVARALLAAGVVAASWLIARKETDDVTSLLLVTAAWAGAARTFDFRPSSAAMLFVVLSIAARKPLTHGILSALWINVHPSALLAPGIALLTTRRPLPVIASLAGLLINPWGWRAIAAPLELLAFVGSGTFINTEWLPSSPRLFPIPYICVVAGAAAFAVSKDVRTHWWRIALFAGFSFLAIRHVRHQPLFFGAFPLLIAPALPRVRSGIALGAATAVIVVVGLTTNHQPGISPERFPVKAIERLEATGLRGNIYNPDQFGGYLIWTFYPRRRVLTDGRNEMYRSFIPEVASAIRDERRWRAFLERYEINLAVDEYRPPLEVVEAGTNRTRRVPASLAYWPRKDWALIAHDQAAMVFARRSAYPSELIEQWEIRAVPDAPN
jgi:hypothetical protein